MFKDAGIQMDTLFGDGSQARGCFLGKLMSAGKRLLTGEALFTTAYTKQASQKLRVAFSAFYAGKIIPMDLSKMGGRVAP